MEKVKEILHMNKSGHHDAKNQPKTHPRTAGGVSEVGGEGSTYGYSGNNSSKLGREGATATDETGNADLQSQRHTAKSEPGTGAVAGGYGASRTTGSATQETGGHGQAGVGEDGKVIDRKFVTGTEERPQDQAFIENYREHNPYAKEYKTTVQHTGRERQIGSDLESLGTKERVVGQDNIVGNPHDALHHHMPEGAIHERPGGEGWVQGKAGPVCDSKTFEVTGDRTVDKERVTDLRQHNKFEKEFEVATKLQGEHGAGAQQPEVLDRNRVVVDEKSKNACEGHPRI